MRKKEVWIFKKFGKKIKSGYWGIGMICSQRQKIKLKCEFLEENVDNFSETCL